MNSDFVIRLEIPRETAKGLGLLTAFAAVCVPALLYASQVTTPNTFATGDVIKAADMNANFAALEAGIDDNDTRITTNTTRLGTLSNLETAAQGDLVSAINEARGWTTLSSGTLTATATQIPFPAIDSRYTEFEIVLVGTTTVNSVARVRLNNNTTLTDYAGGTTTESAGSGWDTIAPGIRLGEGGAVSATRASIRLLETPAGVSVRVGGGRNNSGGGFAGGGLLLNVTDLTSVQAVWSAGDWNVGTRYVLMAR